MKNLFQREPVAIVAAVQAVVAVAVSFGAHLTTEQQGLLLAALAALLGLFARSQVTPALPAKPPPGPDAGAITVSTLLLVVAVVCLAIFTLAAHGTITTTEGFTWLGAGLTFWCLAGLVP